MKRKLDFFQKIKKLRGRAVKAGERSSAETEENKNEKFIIIEFFITIFFWKLFHLTIELLKIIFYLGQFFFLFKMLIFL